MAEIAAVSAADDTQTADSQTDEVITAINSDETDSPEQTDESADKPTSKRGRVGEGRPQENKELAAKIARAVKKNPPVSDGEPRLFRGFGCRIGARACVPRNRLRCDVQLLPPPRSKV